MSARSETRGDARHIGRAAAAVATANGGRLETRVLLYSLSDVRNAIGLDPEYDEAIIDGPEGTPPKMTEQQGRLMAILDKGEEGCWRSAVGPTAGTLSALDDLERRAPHLAEIIALFRRNAKAALTMKMPCFLTPTLLLGEPGTGKTWLLARLARVLGVPFRHHPLNLASLSDGLSGTHPSWRNASPGLVARTLLQEREVNPLIFVDEIDKPSSNAQGDPYRAFYTLLDPSGAKDFVDEFLNFGMDASRVMWIAAANDVSCIPAPILDRLTIVEVPSMTKEHRRAVAASVFDEQNAARKTYFGPLDDATVDCLVGLHPRAIRLALEEAMAEAAARGSREIDPDDVKTRPGRSGTGFGFRF